MKVINFLYELFSSVKLAIVLLLTLAVTSIVGTLIEQQQDPESYLKEYGETTYKILKFLGFTDVYHSWWYILLLTLLGMNLIVCSIKRLPKIWKIAKQPRKTFPQGAESNLKVSHSITLEGKIEEIESSLIRLLKKFRYSVERSLKEEDEHHLFADKNVFARFGVYIVHFGVLIVLIGGLVTAIFGYKGFMNLAPQTESSVVLDFGSNKEIKLPFSIKCNKFYIERYPSGMIKAYVSDLSVIKDGKEVMRKKIKVNDPLKYEGVYFYQANYYATTAYFKVIEKDKERIVKGTNGQVIKIGNVELIPIIYEVKDPFGRLITIKDFGVEIRKNGKSISFRVFPNTLYPLSKDNDSYFYLIGIYQEYATGLQVSKDPGTWIVWVGSTILIFGLIVTFFIPHRRIWARIEKKGENKVKLVIGGLSNKGTEGLAREMEEILREIKSLYCPNTRREEQS